MGTQPFNSPDVSGPVWDLGNILVETPVVGREVFIGPKTVVDLAVTYNFLFEFFVVEFLLGVAVVLLDDFFLLDLFFVLVLARLLEGDVVIEIEVLMFPFLFCGNAGEIGD